MPSVPLARAYSPWETLLPRSWSPQLTVNGDEFYVGAAVATSDVTTGE